MPRALAGEAADAVAATSIARKRPTTYTQPMGHTRHRGAFLRHPSTLPCLCRNAGTW